MNVCKETLGGKCIPCHQILFFLESKSGFLLFYIVVLNCRKLHKLVWFNSESKCKRNKVNQKYRKRKEENNFKIEKGLGDPFQPSTANGPRPIPFKTESLLSSPPSLADKQTPRVSFFPKLQTASPTFSCIDPLMRFIPGNAHVEGLSI
jgi:hypothetical protein